MCKFTRAKKGIYHVPTSSFCFATRLCRGNSNSIGKRRGVTSFFLCISPACVGQPSQHSLQEQNVVRSSRCFDPQHLSDFRVSIVWPSMGFEPRTFGIQNNLIQSKIPDGAADLKIECMPLKALCNVPKMYFRQYVGAGSKTQNINHSSYQAAKRDATAVSRRSSSSNNRPVQ